MKHKHHIVPRHAGGSDDPSNIILLTVPEHAEAHRILFEQHGRLQDKLAWQALTKQIENEEIQASLCKMGASITHEIKRKKAYAQGTLQNNGLKGTTKSITTRKKQSIGVKAFCKTHPDFKNAVRTWTILFPTGNTEKITNLYQFCRENKLTPSGFSYSRRTNKSYRGYKVLEKE